MPVGVSVGSLIEDEEITVVGVWDYNHLRTDKVVSQKRFT